MSTAKHGRDCSISAHLSSLPAAISSVGPRATASTARAAMSSTAGPRCLQACIIQHPRPARTASKGAGAKDDDNDDKERDSRKAKDGAWRAVKSSWPMDSVASERDEVDRELLGTTARRTQGEPERTSGPAEAADDKGELRVEGTRTRASLPSSLKGSGTAVTRGQLCERGGAPRRK